MQNLILKKPEKTVAPRLLMGALAGYATLSLDSAIKINLNERIETKLVIPVMDMLNVLPEIKNHFLVQINKNFHPFSRYQTTYWDTDELLTFRDHVRGKGNRFKIRKRFYTDSSDCFLEFKKKKHNKTIKLRSLSENIISFTDADINFLTRHFINTNKYEPSLLIEYDRITFWDNEQTGRVTIDVNYQASRNPVFYSFGNTAIVEIKGTYQFINNTLRIFRGYFRHNQSGFSKYVIGMIACNHFHADRAKSHYFNYKNLLKINNPI